MAVEPREASLIDHRDCHSRARSAVEDPSNRRLQLVVIDSAICVPGVLAFVRSDLRRAHRLCSFLASPMGAPSATGRGRRSLPMPAEALASAPEADGTLLAESLVTRLWVARVFCTMDRLMADLGRNGVRRGRRSAPPLQAKTVSAPVTRA